MTRPIAAAARPLAGSETERPSEAGNGVLRPDQRYAGTHLIIDVVGGVGLDDSDKIRGVLLKGVEACGATLLHLHTHRFSPQGVSGVAVLAESHISVHTWPEIGYGAFDVFMCGSADPWKAVEVLRTEFSARDVSVKEFLRGDREFVLDKD